MFKTIRNAWKLPELRRKLLFVIFALLIFRVATLMLKTLSITVAWSAVLWTNLLTLTLSQLPFPASAITCTCYAESFPAIKSFKAWA